MPGLDPEGKILRSNDTVKVVRQFEKLDYKHRRILLDLNFLENCIKNNVTSKFLQFRLANKDLQTYEVHAPIDNVTRSY